MRVRMLTAANSKKAFEVLPTRKSVTRTTSVQETMRQRTNLSETRAMKSRYANSHSGPTGSQSTSTPDPLLDSQLFDPG